MDVEQLQRNHFFSRYVSPGMKGLEIGPLNRPTFPDNSELQVETLDHATTEELREKYEDDPGIRVEDIVHVDLVWKGGPYTGIKNIPSDYDFVMSAHTIEHSLDVVQFLVDCWSLLAPDGRLFLAVPDKRLMFDFYRPLTTIGDVLMGHSFPEALDLKARIDELEFASFLNGEGAWSREPGAHASLKRIRPKPIRTAERLIELLQERGSWREEIGYRDAHRWVFQPENLAAIVQFLNRLNIVTFDVVATAPGPGCEFFMVLRKTLVNSNQEVDIPGYMDSLVPPEHFLPRMFSPIFLDGVAYMVKASIGNMLTIPRKVLRLFRQKFARLN